MKLTDRFIWKRLQAVGWLLGREEEFEERKQPFHQLSFSVPVVGADSILLSHLEREPFFVKGLEEAPGTTKQ